MNSKKMIKLISVLLLIAIMLTGCNTAVTEETTAAPETAAPEATKEILVNEEEPHESVAPEFENFFSPSEEKNYVNLGDVIRLEGTLVSRSSDGMIAVFRKADVDTMGNVTEIFTVYNAALSKTVLTVSNSYMLGEYDEFDWNDVVVYDEKVNYPSSAMAVTVESLSGINYIKVAKAQITEISEEIREENEDACVYDILLSYSYYDVNGKSIASTASDNVEVYYEISGALVFGKTYAIFDVETGAVVRIVNGENERIFANFDYENEKYGYYAESSYIEVYSKKSGDLVLRYNIGYVASPDIFILEDGDIFLQSITQAVYPELPFDVIYYGSRCNVDQYILDVETGLLHPVELDYIVSAVAPDYEVVKDYVKLGFTEHVVNFALVSFIENGVAGDRRIVVLDNDMSIMYKTDIVIPEHKEMPSSDLFGLEILANGDYLVTLYDVVTSQAIVKKDGTVRTYVPTDAVVTDDFIVAPNGIFDYDMNCLCSFEDMGVTFRFVFGDMIIASCESIGWDELGNEITTEVYYEVVFEEGNNEFYKWMVINDNEIVVRSDSFIIVYDDYHSEYLLYNTDFTRILTTENFINVYEFDGSFVAYTEIEGHNLVYKIVCSTEE